MVNTQVAAENLDEHSGHAQAEVGSGIIEIADHEPFACRAEKLVEQNDGGEQQEGGFAILLNPAATASSTDFNSIAGRSATAGIPKSSALAMGDATAVSNPAFQPYLYAPTSVKK